MVRTTKNLCITVDEEDLRLLNELSKLRKLSKTEVIKEAIRVYRAFLIQHDILKAVKGVQQ